MLRLLEPDEALLSWGDIAVDVAKAMKPGDTRTIADIKKAVVERRMAAWRVTGDAYGHVVTRPGLTRDTHLPALWVLYASGRVWGGPKQRLATMQRMMTQLERHALWTGNEEMRVEDRAAWGAVLIPLGYEQAAKPNGIYFRKAL